MPTISDFFGKASIDNNYAIATTVKTTRLPGVTVIETFDVSKFPPDAPVFFVTYKKTIDPITGNAIITNLVSYKALVNTGANTLTNLMVAPGYTDLGNAVGDFVECIPTSYWGNSLINGLRVSLNDNGTLKNNAVTTASITSSAVNASKIDFGGAGSGVWWEEIGRTTLTSAGNVITVSSLPARKYLKILTYTYPTGGTTTGNLTFNDDVASNYAARVNSNGGADATATGQTSLGFFQANAADDKFLEAVVTNVASRSKQITGSMLQGNGTGAPGRLEFVGSWVNSTNQISKIALTNTGTGSFAIGSEVIIRAHN